MPENDGGDEGGRRAKDVREGQKKSQKPARRKIEEGGEGQIRTEEARERRRRLEEDGGGGKGRRSRKRLEKNGGGRRKWEKGVWSCCL